MHFVRLMLAGGIACAANESQETPLQSAPAPLAATKSEESPASQPAPATQSVAPVSVEEAVVHSQAAPVKPAIATETAESTPGTPVPMISSSADLSPFPISTSIAKQSTPSGQSGLTSDVKIEREVDEEKPPVEESSNVANVDPCPTPGQMVEEEDTTAQTESIAVAIATVIPQTQVEPTPEPSPSSLPTATMTFEPKPTNTPTPAPPTPTPEPFVVIVEPTDIPISFGVEVGEMAHNFRLPYVDGPEYRLENQIGRNVVLIFYRAYW
jgi:hypothetical protein